MMPGNAGEQSDAPSAYIQAKLYEGDEDNSIETWVLIPETEWPKDWKDKYRTPVVRLRFALYGHPDSGLLGTDTFEFIAGGRI